MSDTDNAKDVDIAAVDAYVRLCKIYLKTLTDEERLDFFHAVEADYCRECGRYDGHTSEGKLSCQCWDDE